MSKRLWIVRIVREASVLAPNESEAVQAVPEIEKWEDIPTVTVEHWAGTELPGWDELCYVYGQTKAEVSLPQAKRIDGWKP